MGQRSSTETLFGLVSAFVTRATWTQADLARRLETKSETVRRHLVELRAAGFPLVREEEHPQVYWSMPKGWFPGLLAFSAEEVPDLLRLLGRSERGEDEERWLSLVEDAVRARVPLKMRYFAASRRSETWRHVSPHRVDLRGRAVFVATCHRTRELKRFRVSNVLDARVDRAEAFLAAAPGDLERFEAESLAGYRGAGAKVACAFVVREPEATWVGRNLPDARIRAEEEREGGVRFDVETTAVTVLARFVVGLGDAARCESPELAAEVGRIASGALGNVAARGRGRVPEDPGRPGTKPKPLRLASASRNGRRSDKSA